MSGSRGALSWSTALAGLHGAAALVVVLSTVGLSAPAWAGGALPLPPMRCRRHT